MALRTRLKKKYLYLRLKKEYHVKMQFCGRIHFSDHIRPRNQVHYHPALEIKYLELSLALKDSVLIINKIFAGSITCQELAKILSAL